jgi:phosphoribosylaminoimidazole-succinocarboxamide synthase
MTQISTLENMTRGNSVDKSLFCVFEHSQLSINLLNVLRDFQMLENYLDVLKVEIIIRKYSYLFVII